ILARSRRGSHVVGQLATKSRKQSVGICDRGADRRGIGNVGNVELGGNELIGQYEAGVSVSSRPDRSIEEYQQLRLRIVLAAEREIAHRPSIGVILPVSQLLRTSPRRLPLVPRKRKGASGIPCRQNLPI